MQAAFAALLLAAASARCGEEVLHASSAGAALGAMRRFAAAHASTNPGRRIDVPPSAGTACRLRTPWPVGERVRVVLRPRTDVDSAIETGNIPLAVPGGKDR